MNKQKSRFFYFFPKSKKAMGIGQVFIFIVAAITFALIMIFGYKAIGSFLASGEDVEFVQFKTGLENSVKTIYTEYGSVRIKQFNLPQKYEQICFVNVEYSPSADELNALCKKSPRACDIWEENNGEGAYDKVNSNVFLTPSEAVPIKVYQISILDEEQNKEIGFLCTPIIKGLFSIVLEGKGDHTELSKAS